MLDIKLIREDIEGVKKRLGPRGEGIDFDKISKLDEKRRSLLQEVEVLKEKINKNSIEVGSKKKNKENADDLIKEMQGVGEEIKTLDEQIGAVDSELKSILLTIPNIPHESVPEGANEDDNKEVRVVGDKPSFSFKVKDHIELGESLGIMDFERAAKLSGARYSLLTGAGARLERALINFMLDLHTEKHGYKEALPPFILKSDSFFGTGQLPKFEDDLFKMEGLDSYLIPTAEVPITNIHREEILQEDTLPIKYTAYTPCFRKEAGSYGKDVKGLIRQHQFNKVELVKFVKPEDSYDELEALTNDAEEVLKLLGLHYRVMLLCTGDMGFSSAKTYDLEVWLPGQDTFREISSCSNFEDFQSRRASIKYKPSHKEAGKKTTLLHTLNGSALAIGRTMVAILENYQREDGTVQVPDVLLPYMNGMAVISKD